MCITKCEITYIGKIYDERDRRIHSKSNKSLIKTHFYCNNRFNLSLFISFIIIAKVDFGQFLIFKTIAKSQGIRTVQKLKWFSGPTIHDFRWHIIHFIPMYVILCILRKLKCIGYIFT